MQFSAAVTWDIMHNEIWRHCSKRLSEASMICVPGSFHRKGCGMFEAPLPLLACFGMENLNLIAPELLECHTRFGNMLHKERYSFCLASSLCAKITFF